MEINYPIGGVPLNRDESTAAELSISPALVSPFCEIAQEYFATFVRDYKPHVANGATLNTYLERLCLDYEGIHASNKIHFSLRLHALSAMVMIGMQVLMPRELWQTNGNGVATPAPALIRAAMVVPWPTITTPDSVDAEVAARQLWNEFVHRCIASSLSPLGLCALAKPATNYLH